MDLFIILTRIYHAFGPDVDLEVPESEFSKINKFDADLEEWRSAWLPRLGTHNDLICLGWWSEKSANIEMKQLEVGMSVRTLTKPSICTTTSLVCN